MRRVIGQTIGSIAVMCALILGGVVLQGGDLGFVPLTVQKILAWFTTAARNVVDSFRRPWLLESFGESVFDRRKTDTSRGVPR